MTDEGNVWLEMKGSPQEAPNGPPSCSAGSASPLPDAPASQTTCRPQEECNSPDTISSKCDKPLNIRVHIGPEFTLGLLNLARTFKVPLFLVRACLRPRVPKSTDFGSVCVAFLELLVKTFRSFRLGSLDLVLGRQPYPQNTQRDTFSRP